jgi:hypothetical protein
MKVKIHPITLISFDLFSMKMNNQKNKNENNNNSQQQAFFSHLPAYQQN